MKQIAKSVISQPSVAATLKRACSQAPQPMSGSIKFAKNNYTGELYT